MIDQERLEYLEKIEQEYNNLVSFLKDHMMTISNVKNDEEYKVGDVLEYIGVSGNSFSEGKTYKILQSNSDRIIINNNEFKNHHIQICFVKKWFKNLTNPIEITYEVGDYLCCNINSAGLTKDSIYKIIEINNSWLRYIDDDGTKRHWDYINGGEEYKKMFTLIKK